MRAISVVVAFVVSALFGSPPSSGGEIEAVPGAPGQSATLMPDGRWLLLGGMSADGPLDAARLWDSRSGSAVDLSGRLAHARAWHTATVLANGTVLVLGGIGGEGQVLGAPELFDAETGAFRVITASLWRPRMRHTATLLTDGRLLVAGGISPNGATLATADLWNPRAETDAPEAVELSGPRADHRAILSADGSVLLQGGVDEREEPCPSTDRFDPERGRFALARDPSADSEAAALQVAATLPEAGSEGIPIDGVIAVRFSAPIAVQQSQSAVAAITGPDGVRDARVVSAEAGRLLFVAPRDPLASGTTYTVSISGLAADDLAIESITFGFTTAAPSGGIATAAPRSAAAGGAAGWALGPDSALPAPPARDGSTADDGPGLDIAPSDAGGESGRAGRPRDAMAAVARGASRPPAPPTAPTPGSTAWDGFSVDLSTGLFVYEKTDLYVHELAPIALTRVYRPGDTASRAFGIGSTHTYDLHLVWGPGATHADLVLPDGSSLRYSATSVAGLEHAGTPTAFHRSRLSTPPLGSMALDLSDGSGYQFSVDALLRSTSDRFLKSVIVDRVDEQVGAPGRGDVARLSSYAGRWIELSYDSGHRITAARDNIGRTVLYGYDGSGRLVSVTDAEGGVTRYAYDDAHRMVTIQDPRGVVSLTNEYDADGRVSRQLQADGSAFAFAYALDGAGRVARADVTDPRGAVRRVTFDARGYATADTRALGTPPEQTTTYERDAIGLVLSTTDALGRKTTFTYDDEGHVTSVTRLAGEAGATTTGLDYTVTGAQLRPIRQLASIADPLGHTTSLAYDTQSDGISAVTDPLGSRTSIRAVAGLLGDIADPIGHTTNVQYDLAGNVVALTDPTEAVTRGAYDDVSRLTARMDPLSRVTGYAYDRLDRLTAITDPAGGVTGFQYDASGNVLVVTDARGKVTRYAYDAMGRVTSRMDPLGRSESYVYDALGNVTSWADRSGQLTTVAYDALERPASVTYADGSSTTFQWDAGNRLAQAVDSAAGAITRVWDRHDRLVSESTPAATVAYTYDAAGRRTSMTANGVPTTYEYDAASRVTRISTAAATVDIAYDAAGRRSRLDLPNGVAVEHAYDMASRLTRLTYRLGETVLGALTYRYDAAGNRVRVGGSWARIGMPEPLAAASYDDANRPLAFGARILTHDPAGHLTSDGENAYQWNARHQLVAVDGPGLALRYAYDALGRRRSREAGGVSTSFVYDGIQAVAEAGAVPVALLAGLGVDEHLAFMDPGGRRVPLTDAIGSVIAVSDDEGALTVQHTYTPFGLSGSAGDGDSHRLLFAGREWEHSGGLHFNRSRYYHAVLQRFLSEDPIGFAAADANLYAYARNNPLGLNDPLGLEAHVATYPNAVGTVGAGIFPMATASIHAVPPRPGVPRAFGPPTMLGHDAVSVARMIAIPTSPELERALQAAVDIAAPRGRCRADARSGAPGTTGTAGPSVPWAWMPAHPLLTPATAVERAPRPTPWAWLDVSAPGQPPYVTRAR